MQDTSFLHNFFFGEIEEGRFRNKVALAEMNFYVPGCIDPQDGFGARDRGLEHQAVEHQAEEMDSVLTDPSASEPSLLPAIELQEEAQWHQTTTAQSSES